MRQGRQYWKTIAGLAMLGVWPPAISVAAGNDHGHVPIYVNSDATIAPVEGPYNGYAFRPPELVEVSVPFAEGRFSPKTPFTAFDLDGAPLPTETKVLSTWPDGTIRWARLSFESHASQDKWKPDGYRGDVLPERSDATKSKGGLNLYLPWSFNVRGGVVPPVPKHRVHVTNNGNSVVVDNGRLIVRIGSGKAAFGFSSVKLARTQRTASGPLELQLDREGAPSLRTTASTAEHVEIVQATPLKAVIMVSGRFLGEYAWQTLLTFHANEPAIRAEHTLTGLGDKEVDRIQAISLNYTADLGRSFFARVPGATIEFSDHVREGEAIELAQTAPTFDPPGDFFYQILVRNSGLGRVLGRGGRSDGWIRADGPSLSVGVAIRNFAPMAPKNISIRSGGQIRVDLWPRAGILLFSKARSITHELLYVFHEPQSSSALPEKYYERSYALQKEDIPLRAWVRAAVPVVDADYLCGTRAFGPYVTTTSSILPKLESTLRQNFEISVLRRADRWTHYGMLHFGDYIAPWPGDNGGNPPQPHWRNHEWEFGEALFTRYVRTGEALPLAEGIVAYRHHMDVDVHATRPLNFYHGYGNNAEMHQGYRGPHAGHLVAAGLVDAYWLTGDTRPLRTAQRLADWYTQVFVEKNEYFARIAGGKSPALRDFAWPMLALMRTYEASGEKRYLRAARKGIEYIREHPERWEGGTWGSALMLAVIEQYHRLTGEDVIANFYMESVDRWIRNYYLPDKRAVGPQVNGPPFGYGPGSVSTGPSLMVHAASLTYAYELSKDLGYLRIVLDLLDQGMKSPDEVAARESRPTRQTGYQTGATRSDGKFYAMQQFWTNRIPTAFSALTAKERSLLLLEEAGSLPK